MRRQCTEDHISPMALPLRQEVWGMRPDIVQKNTAA